MINDALVAFVPINAPLSLVGANAQTFASGIVDLLGSGVGTAPPNIIGTGRSTFGTDMGIGGRRPELNVVLSVGLVGTAGNTLKVALQAAQDQGVAGGYQPSTWYDVDSEDGIALANVATVGAGAGSVIFRSPWIPTFPPGLMPRYLRLLFSPQSVAAGITTTPGGSFTAGTVGSATVTMVRDDWAAKYANRNYSVS